MSKNCKTRDMVSNLPDSILHHILSLLHIKDCARTSILSHRWNYLWTTAPVLDFTITTFSHPTTDTEQFMDFIDGTLHRHKLSNVDKFFLTWCEHLNEARVHSWVSNVVKSNVKELRLFLHQNQPLFIPLSLFTCETLTSLELLTDPHVCLPKHISLPRLKRLKLIEFEISEEYWNDEFFSNSTVLEELFLHRCFYRVRNFCISVPTLKLLQIDTSRDVEDGLQDCVLKIDAPRLVTFSYQGCVAKEFVLSGFLLLEEAAVDFTFEENFGAEGITRLLRGLPNVAWTVDNTTLLAFRSACYASNNLLIFHNVKILKMSDKLTTDQGLTALLKAVPNLESLVFVKYMLDEIAVYSSGEDDSDVECEDNFDSEDYSWELDTATTGCLFPHLKSVCFEHFVGNPREMKWAKLILKDAKALQKMTIRYINTSIAFIDAKFDFEVTELIPSFPRASAGCVFKFCSWDWK